MASESTATGSMIGPFKAVAQRTYVHVDCVATIEERFRDELLVAERLTQLHKACRYNIIRFGPTISRVALLHYPDFFDEPFPALMESWLVDVKTETIKYRTYENSENPPILHRKELLLPLDHSRRGEYVELTEAAETLGLFDQPNRIGYKRQWLELVHEKGYRVVGHEFVPLGNDESEKPATGEVSLHDSWQAARHLTALVRYGFSAPVQSLARYGFLDGKQTVFDYGCGRGDDVRGLSENGLDAKGWDPYFAPNSPVCSADIVNLGFVINVIENADERLTALTNAFSLAKRLLVVSVMLANRNDTQWQSFRDGVLTRRGTFQKYYTQAQFKAYIEDILKEEPILVAPGVLYVFRDKNAEQRFLVDRYRSRGNRLNAPRKSESKAVSRPRRDRAAEKYSEYKESLERLWNSWLSLGRRPDKSEVEDLLLLIEGFGSLVKALRFIEARKDPSQIDTVATQREEDLKVYFALNQFGRHQTYKSLERRLQRDIKHFFGDYRTAQSSGLALLKEIASTDAIEQACKWAAEHGVGWLEDGESLQLHASMVERLPSVLRVYIGAGAILYGDYRNADLVKIHIRSGKISLLLFDDFEGLALPRMLERVKIRLREQDIDYFRYGEEYEPPYLFHKSRYINEEFPYYPKQVEFEGALAQLELFDLSGFGPNAVEFVEKLRRNRWTINGFDLNRATELPDIDQLCGQNLTFRQLIECGETQRAQGLLNLPRQVETYNALHDLAVHVLDPVIDYFGMIELTYAFCSSELAKRIPGRIAVKRDQHSSHELNRRGSLICDRLGAAVDFVVLDESMLEVSQWIVAQTPFDRLYFYGENKPIHVSYGPNQSRQIVRMVAGKSGRLVPRVTSSTTFLALTSTVYDSG